MAIMSRKKRAVAQSWNAIDEQRKETNQPKEEIEKKEVSQEEHEERIKKLKEIGLLKY